MRAVDVVGEADAGPAVVLVLRERDRSRVGRVAGERRALDLGVARLRELLVFVAQAEAQRDLVGDAPVVLGEPVVIGGREEDVAVEAIAAQVELLVVAGVVPQVGRGPGDERRASGRTERAVRRNRVDVRVGIDARTLEQVDERLAARS